MPAPLYADCRKRAGGGSSSPSVMRAVAAAGKTYRDLLIAVEQAGLDRATLTFEHIEPPDVHRTY